MRLKGEMIMWMDCDKYYEEYLGDCCDNDCEMCWGNKEWVFAKDTFTIPIEGTWDEATIEKGQRFWIIKELPDGRIRLGNPKLQKEKREYLFRGEYFKEHFKYFE